MQHFKEEFSQEIAKTPIERSRKHIYFMIIFEKLWEINTLSDYYGGFASFSDLILPPADARFGYYFAQVRKEEKLQLVRLNSGRFSTYYQYFTP